MRLRFNLLWVALAITLVVPCPAATAADAPAPTQTAANNPPASPKVTFSQTHVDGPYIAITFDDGPSAEQTPRLLNMLKERGIKATFFCLGECIANNPEIAQRIVAEGHEIGNHSWSHPQLSTMNEENVRSQIQRTHDVIRQTTGVTVTDFRPPYGAFTQRQQRWAAATWNYNIVLWDVDPLDWKYHIPARVESEILKGTTSGSIILVHDIHKTSVDAMPTTLDNLLKKGFKFVTVAELLKMDKPAPAKAPTPTKETKTADARP
jgi:peptidoglycan/xylan/chitin deacetylase (PgdA/CDA1 family)